MKVKFHKNCDFTGKILKISYARYNFVKFDIHFFLGGGGGLLQMIYYIFSPWQM